MDEDMQTSGGDDDMTDDAHESDSQAGSANNQKQRSSRKRRKRAEPDDNKRNVRRRKPNPTTHKDNGNGNARSANEQQPTAGVGSNDDSLDGALDKHETNASSAAPTNNTGSHPFNAAYVPTMATFSQATLNPLPMLRNAFRRSPGRVGEVAQPSAPAIGTPSRSVLRQPPASQTNQSGNQPTESTAVEAVVPPQPTTNEETDDIPRPDNKVDSRDIYAKIQKQISDIVTTMQRIAPQLGAKRLVIPRRTTGWFLLFLAFQIVFYPFTANPIWSSIVNQSKSSLAFYKSILQTSEQTLVKEESLPDVQVKNDEIEQPILEEIIDGVKKLEALKESLDASTLGIRVEADGLSSASDVIGEQIRSKERELQSLESRLLEARNVFTKAINDDDVSSQAWTLARRVASDLGRTLLDGGSLDVWEVGEPVSCSASSLPGDLVHPNEVDVQNKDLRLQARLSAERMMSSPESAGKIREWIKLQIEKAIDGNADAAHALSQLPSSQPDGMNLEDVERAIQERLEIENADRTGQIDHACILNGARVIRDGKRGTSRSLVDSLPVLNRLMQLAALRFYGHGPEAALTPTYPIDSLGQCWSLMQTPVSEKPKRLWLTNDRDDDHKRGNFGTLTVSLAAPVYVRSVVIEHPTEGVTDQITSAIRSFRIIGYADSTASGKSWSLGSFEFDISKSRVKAHSCCCIYIFI